MENTADGRLLFRLLFMLLDAVPALMKRVSGEDLLFRVSNKNGGWNHIYPSGRFMLFREGEAGHDQPLEFFARRSPLHDEADATLREPRQDRELTASQRG